MTALAVRLLEAPARSSLLDPAAGALTAIAAPVAARPGLTRLLRGSWLGHPVHPAVVVAPLGLAIAAGVARCMRDEPAEVADEETRPRDVSRTLLVAAVLSTVPAIVTGLAEYTALRRPGRRVASTHALLNVAGTSLFVLSLAGARRPRPVPLTAGLAMSGLAAALGGHVAYNHRAGGA